jgi:hypothetical protein
MLYYTRHRSPHKEEVRPGLISESNEMRRSLRSTPPHGGGGELLGRAKC